MTAEQISSWMAIHYPKLTVSWWFDNARYVYIGDKLVRVEVECEITNVDKLEEICKKYFE